MRYYSNRPNYHLHKVINVYGHGGAPQNYADLWKMFSLSDKINLHGHNLFSSLNEIKQEVSVSTIENGDVVLCNAGPYAHFYHYIREKNKKNFRIIRDARTAFWAPYLLQENLCAPLLREGDLLVVPSAYAAKVYRRLFPHINQEEIVIAYPINLGFSETEQSQQQSKVRLTEQLRLGYLGRLSEDKNFPELANFLVNLDESRYSAVLAGPLYPQSLRCKTALNQLLSARPTAKYLGIVPRTKLKHFFDSIDVLLFPSASSNETFGRVQFEARSAGIPVLAADFGPMSDILPIDNLVAVNFNLITNKSLSSPFSFGWVDEHKMITALSGGLDHLVHNENLTQYNFDNFIDIITNSIDQSNQINYSTRASGFLSGINVSGLDIPSRSLSLQMIKKNITVLENLQSNLFKRISTVIRVPWKNFQDPLIRQVAIERMLNSTSIEVLRTGLLLCAALKFNPRLTYSDTRSPKD